jgi:hypothetical protein
VDKSVLNWTRVCQPHCKTNCTKVVVVGLKEYASHTPFINNFDERAIIKTTLTRSTGSNPPSLIIADLASGSSTVVAHSTSNPEIEG